MALFDTLPPHARQGTTVALTTYFLVTLLLDRFSGWQVSSAHPLIAGSALAFFTWRDRPREAGRLFLLLCGLIAWMLWRDVGTGGDWRAGERTLKASLLLLGLIASSRLSVEAWCASLRGATTIGVACVIAYLGVEQILAGLSAPLAMAETGFASEMNRNALALPLGLLACWVVAAARPIWPPWLWGLLAIFMVMLMIANGSRNALLSMVVAVLLAAFLLSPRRVAVMGGAAVAGALLLFWISPAFWVHGDSVVDTRILAWEAVLRHFGTHALTGTGSSYFSRVIAPALPQDFAIAHNVYLDFLLAYGIVGATLLAAVGFALDPLLQSERADTRSAWLYASGAYLMVFGLFDREHRDPLMLAGMLMLSGIAMALLAAAFGRNQQSKPGWERTQLRRRSGFF